MFSCKKISQDYREADMKGHKSCSAEIRKSKTEKGSSIRATEDSAFVRSVVSYFSRGNVSLQNARFITKKEKDAKRDVLANHKFN